MQVGPIKQVLFSGAVLILSLIVAEHLLRLFLPFSYATVGRLLSKNAALYGWGYDCHDLIRVRDPDTGTVYADLANNHGWRDKDRSFVNQTKAYRILVLGDSVTFGVVVPAEQIYTRILENRLRVQGFNAEVINVSYGGWGTDQELEALENEGLQYHPDLVIIQFHQNDLREISYWCGPTEQRKRAKPFYYTLDRNGHLVRHKNPRVLCTWKERIKFHLLKWEIGKRLYYAYFILRWRETPVADTQETQKDVQDDQSRSVTFSVSQGQINQLELAIGLNSENSLYKYLNNKINKEIDGFELRRIIKVSGNDRDRNTILRVLEKRSFHSNWSREVYYPKQQAINSPSWQLYFGLIDKANSLIKEANSQLALFCHNNPAQYDWNVAWCRLSNDVTSRGNFLQYCQIIRDYSEKHGIGFVDNLRYYRFARNDPHPNIEGNRAMAEDIYDYLILHHVDDLNLHRLTRLSTNST